jgi:hypothetical protein
MIRRLFPVMVVGVAAVLCAGSADAAKLKTIIPDQSQATAVVGGKRSLPQRSDGENDHRISRSLDTAPAKFRPAGASGGGSHTDREA